MLNENNEYKLETGESVKYRYYRLVPSDVYKNVERKVKRKHGYKKEVIKVRQNIKEYYTEETIARFQLENHSKLLPDMNGNKTIINNYLLRFWGPTFHPRSGGIAAYTFIVLQSYCWDKDYVWISLDTIGTQITASVNSVKKYLTILEDHGFIIRFWREEETDTNNKGTILIKVRQTLPLLSREQYNNLPLKLRKEHDRFMERIKRESQLEFDLSHNYKEIYEDLRKQVINVSEPTGALKEEIENLEEYEGDYQASLEKMSEEELIAWNKVLNKIQDKVSKPSFDTWLKKSVAYKDEFDVWLICLPNEFVKTWVEENYVKLIQESMQELNITYSKIKFGYFD